MEAGRTQDTQAFALLSLIALAAARASWRRGDMPVAGPLHQLLSLLGVGERGWGHPPGSCRIHSFGSSLNCLPRGDTSPDLVTISLPSDPYAPFPLYLSPEHFPLLPDCTDLTDLPSCCLSSLECELHSQDFRCTPRSLGIRPTPMNREDCSAVLQGLTYSVKERDSSLGRRAGGT